MKQNWEYKKLGDIASFNSGNRPAGGVGRLKEGALSLGGEHIGRNGRIDLSSAKYVSHEYYASNQKGHIFDGDILLCKDGALTGKVAIERGELHGLHSMVNEHVFIIRTTVVSQWYLFYYLFSPTGQTLIQERITGSAQGGINGSQLKTIPIPYPKSIQEQLRIVAELDLLTGIIDKQKVQLKELDNLAQSIFYDMFGDPIENPKGWDVKKLGDVCSVVNGLVDPNEEPYCNYPHIGGANIQSNTGVFVDVKLAKDEGLISGKYLFDESMILYSKIRPNLNKVALPSFKGICSADMYPLITNTDVANKYYIKFSITHKKFIEYAVSHSGRANIPKINREALLAYDLPVPPLKLQQEFADKITAIESQKSAINQSMADTQKLLDYTMDKYFG